MIEAIDISVTKRDSSKLQDISLQNIPFGKFFTDHMLVADYTGGEWKNVEIKPYQPLLIDPSNAAWHYGQAIFEGIKAYRQPNGDVAIFRPQDNFARFNRSAARMQMPEVPEEIFVEGMRQLIALDSAWVPGSPDHSLYIRPFMIATDEMIGVRPSSTYKFMIILSPTGPYYAAPMRIYVEEKFVRAAVGGVGYAKAAGNYAASMFPTETARKLGYDQVLWTDAQDHEFVQEIGVMNVIFIVGKKVLTPGLEDGTILAGITRDSVLTVLREMGFAIEERHVSIHELVDAFKKGELKEVFGAGTAATIAMIKELRYKDFVMQFDINTWTTAPAVKEMLNDIRCGNVPDVHGWLMKV